MNHRGFGPPRGSIGGNSFFPFILGGVVGSLLTNNNRRYPMYYPYPYYQYYPYYPYNNYYR